MRAFRFAPLALALLLAPPLAAQKPHEVNVTDFAFSPADLTINVGETVRWTNTQGLHNVNGTLASYPSNPEGFGNAVASSPWTYEFTFDLPGTYGYHCDLHGAPGVGMAGTVTVQGVSSTEDDLPPGFALGTPTPNPFRDETAFALTVATPAPVRVAVYDVLGREVDVLHDGPLPAGTPVPFVWAPAAARAGAYLVRVEGPGFRAARKVVRVH
jgi:plastocyanin